MNIQELIEKAKTEKLSEAETKQVFDGMIAEFAELKEKDPEKYLKMLTELNSIVGELNSSLKAAL